MAKLRIALLAGGLSNEREVSLKTGDKIFEALDRDKYQVTRFDPKTDLAAFFNEVTAGKFDLVFPALHGPYGEDGRLQGMLDMLGLPYVFSDCLSSAIAMDKIKTKLLASAAGLTLAPDIRIGKHDAFDTKTAVLKLSLPIVVKPADSGSSVGITIAQNEAELKRGVDEAFRHGATVLLEKFVKGREFTVAVMGKNVDAHALPVVEIIPKISAWFDHKAKYEVGGSEEICPAKIPDAVRDRVQSDAVKIYNAIGCKDLARADFIWSEADDKLYFLEINTIPGMTATSLAPQAAKAAGMEFGEFLDKLIEGALKIK
jgi:D-alanine-D-alanine ligase